MRIDPNSRPASLRRLRAASWALVSLALFGCATPREYSPAEFRDAMKNNRNSLYASMYAIETFDAPRGYAQLTETMRRKSKECLDVTVERSGMVYQGNMMMRESSRTEVKNVLSVQNGKTELTVRTGVYNVYGLDLVPAGKNTRVTFYRGKVGVSNTIHTAVQGWVKGNSTACPNWNG